MNRRTSLCWVTIPGAIAPYHPCIVVGSAASDKGQPTWLLLSHRAVQLRNDPRIYITWRGKPHGPVDREPVLNHIPDWKNHEQSKTIMWPWHENTVTFEWLACSNDKEKMWVHHNGIGMYCVANCWLHWSSHQRRIQRKPWTIPWGKDEKQSAAGTNAARRCWRCLKFYVSLTPWLPQNQQQPSLTAAFVDVHMPMHMCSCENKLAETHKYAL